LLVIIISWCVKSARVDVATREEQLLNFILFAVKNQGSFGIYPMLLVSAKKLLTFFTEK